MPRFNGVVCINSCCLPAMSSTEHKLSVLPSRTAVAADTHGVCLPSPPGSAAAKPHCHNTLCMLCAETSQATVPAHNCTALPRPCCCCQTHYTDDTNGSISILDEVCTGTLGVCHVQSIHSRKQATHVSHAARHRQLDWVKSADPLAAGVAVGGCKRKTNTRTNFWDNLMACGWLAQLQ